MAFKLLLDVDGVLVRNPELVQKVDDNVARYVSKKLPHSKNPKVIAKMLFKKYGHTAIGLKQAFRVDASDFDEFVYDRKLIDSLWEHLSGNEFQKEAEIVSNIADKVPTILFSNSPPQWTIPVASAISDAVSISSPLYLKPDRRAYKSFPPNIEYLFVDDRLANVKTADKFENWHPILFSDTKSKFATIGSIWELDLLVNSVLKDGNLKSFLI